MPPRRKRNAKNSAASYDEMYPPSGDPALEAPEAADPGPGSAAADAPPADAPAADSPAAAVADPEAARRELETAHRAQARVFRMDLQKKKKEATAKGKDAAKAWRSEEQRLEKEFLDQQAQEMRLLEERLAAMSALRTAEAAEEPGSSTTRAQRRRVRSGLSPPPVPFPARLAQASWQPRGRPPSFLLTLPSSRGPAPSPAPHSHATPRTRSPPRSRPAMSRAWPRLPFCRTSRPLKMPCCCPCCHRLVFRFSR